jgi:hypothetical protein
MKVLYTSRELQASIKQVLASPETQDRRVVLVAFVGGKAQAFLPDPAGLEIVCWLHPGSSDALTLARLRKRGATLFKSDRLHTKVYWSSRRGCVICSANASGLALGGGTQKEAGVWLPAGAVDIDRLWSEAKPSVVTPGDLKKLARQSDRVYGQTAGSTEGKPPSFLEWNNLSGHSNWKLFPWEYDAEWAALSKSKAKNTYGVEHPRSFIDFQEGSVKPFEWLLTFKSPSLTQFEWLFIDFIIKVPKTDKAAYLKDYPFQAVQANSNSHHRPPFKLDSGFIKAFKKAIKSYGANRVLQQTTTHQKRFLEVVAKELSVH